ncbi:uncharacterized protein [Rhodnius prolixus]|uniref:uncharacterized protein n=1 Tax=Rhodnius prolixus TaxID=13249 RepID=UPI003D188C8F
MIIKLLMMFSWLLPVYLSAEASIRRSILYYSTVEVRNNAEEQCAGILIGLKSVLVSDCNFLKRTDLRYIKVKIDGKIKKVKQIKQCSVLYKEGKLPPLHLLKIDVFLYGKLFPITLNGGDLLEKCDAAMIRDYAFGIKEDLILKHVKPKPYEVCRREFPEIRFSRKELCVSDDNIGGFIFEPGSPLLCNDYLTGIKLFSQRLPRKKNFTLHIYIRMAQLINWFIEENIEDSPNWVVLESDDEEKAIIGQNIRMAFKNGGVTQKPQWMISTSSYFISLFKKFSKFVNFLLMLMEKRSFGFFFS